MTDYPDQWPCPKCGELCAFEPRPTTVHWGSIRCTTHGFLWIPKPDADRQPRRKVNSSLADQLPESLRHFCWNCQRHRDHLKALRPAVVLQVHHVIEVRDGGTDDPENLQLLCAECHAEVHRRREAFRRYRSA